MASSATSLDKRSVKRMPSGIGVPSGKMLKIELSHIVAKIVQSELRGKGREKEALYFNFDIRLSFYTEDKNYDESCGLHLLYHCNPHESYISVFTGVTENSFVKIDKVEWKHGVTHDSCWRDISTFSDVYFGMANKINKRLIDDDEGKVAPKDMALNIFLTKNLFSWVPVEVHKELDSYRRIVTIL